MTKPFDVSVGNWLVMLSSNFDYFINLKLFAADSILTIHWIKLRKNRSAYLTADR